jgi:hypothetical protein
MWERQRSHINLHLNLPFLSGKGGRGDRWLAMPDQPVDLVVIQHIAYLESGDVIVWQHVLLPVKGAAIWHVGAGHGAAGTGGHVDARAVGDQPIVQHRAAGPARGGRRLDLFPLRVGLENIAQVLADAHRLEFRFEMGPGQVVQAAVRQGGVVQGHPQRDGVFVVERPEGVVKMEGCVVAVGRFDQGLVVPDTDAIHLGQRSRQAPQALIEHQLGHAGVDIGQPDALGENLGVEGVRVALVVQNGFVVGGIVVRQTQVNRVHRHITPVLQFFRR